MKRKRKFVLVLLFVVIATVLTGCKGNELSKENISYSYNKRFESVELVNNFDDKVYVDFNIVLLDKNKEILYKEVFETELLDVGSHYYNLEELNPEYISYDKVDSMDAEILSVYEMDYIKIIVLVLGILVITKFIIFSK